MEILGNEENGVYKISGEDADILSVYLDGSNQVTAEAGKMLFYIGNVKSATKEIKEGGSISKHIFSAARKVITDENLAFTTFSGQGEVSFGDYLPGSIAAIKLSGNAIIASKENLIAYVGDINLSVEAQSGLGSLLFGGEGLVLIRISGSGYVFIHGGGNIITHQLKDGQQLHAESASVMAWDESVSHTLEHVKDFKTAYFGDEGLFLTRFSGTGTVLVQTLTVAKLRSLIGNSICLAPPPIMAAELVLLKAKKIITKLMR
ncbi:MAG: AIM24 family protein [Nitrospirae bacterium]|nr:AIM24 family protein [Nitrospirota bacterium]MBF0536161.1 AIM24 family protein [Nitrospirota bacterium]MBF0618214.1 AIM24 family protein [Nitrospirota bacterium]